MSRWTKEDLAAINKRARECASKPARTPATARKAPQATEHAEQAAVCAWWAAYSRSKGLDERLLMASAGGAHLAGDARVRAIQSHKLKASGYRVGTPDLFLANPRYFRESGVVTFYGLFLELKRKGGKASIEQRGYADLLRRQGYCCVIAYGFEEAQRAIKSYLEA